MRIRRHHRHRRRTRRTGIGRRRAARHWCAAAIWSLATGLLLTAALVVTFSEIKPKDVPSLARAGCEWYEGRLNGCDGLTAVPHQPFNTYSTGMFAIAGTFSAFYFAANSSIDRRAATQETRSRRLTTRAYGNKVRWSR